MRSQESPKSKSGILNGLGRLLSPRGSAEAQRRAPSSDVDIARSGRYRVAPLAALALAGVIGMAPGKAKADGLTVECDTPSAVTSVASGGADAYYTPDGYFTHEDTIWNFDSPLYYGSTSNTVTVTDYEGEDVRSLSEVDGMYYADVGGNAVEMTCSGTTCTAADISGLGAAVNGITYHDGAYLYTNTDPWGNESIFELGGSTVWPVYSDPDAATDYYHPESCGSASNYLAIEKNEGTISNDVLVIIDTSTGDSGEYAIGGDRPMCEDNGDGTITVRYTAPDGSGGYPVYETTCTVTTDVVDADEDGVAAGTDCDDDDASVGAASGYVTDADGDNYHADGTEADVCPDDVTATQILATSSYGVDCDDSSSGITTEVSHVHDGDGDGYHNPSVTSVDYCPADAPSGYISSSSSLGEDCDDSSAAVNPSATETPYNGVDDDCDPTTSDDDLDGDGLVHADDCDDTNASITIPVEYGADYDHDGYPDLNDTEGACPGTESADYIEAGGLDHDCDPGDSNTYPGAPEQCDSLDNDCDDVVDNDVVYTNWYVDNDGDGYGAGTARNDCLADDNEVANSDDCDDTDGSVNPSATEEIFDGIDNDCDDTTEDEPSIISTDCEGEITPTSRGSEGSKASDTFALRAGDITCTVTFDLAEDGTNGDKPYSQLYPGSSVSYAFDSTDEDNPYYVAVLEDGTTTETYTNGSPTQVYEGVEGWFLGHEGSARETSYTNGYLDMTVLEPTITLEHDVNGGEMYVEDLERAETFTEEGDRVVVDVEANKYEVNPDDNTDDTGTPETDDTGTPNTEDPDNPGGCNCSTVEDRTRGKLAAVLAGILALTAVRRKD